MKTLYNVSYWLLVIGGLNWLLHGLGWNLVDAIFGENSTLSKIIYILVGIATIVVVSMHKKYCRPETSSAPMV